MKKLYFLIVLAISFATQAQIVNIPDANFKAKLLSASANNQVASSETPVVNPILILPDELTVSSYNTIDTNGDGEIQVSEAQAIKWLNVSNSNISNITGIEAFVNLQVLSCNLNQITSIDVSGLTNLQNFSCYSNQLTTLNILNLADLRFLECYSNQLITLDFSNNFNLKWINCSNNQLTNLNIQNLVLLTTIVANDNQITNTNIVNLPNIFQIILSNNLLTNFDTSGLPLLYSLYISYNQIVNLDCSSNTKLEILFCDNNNLVSLNLKNGNVLSSPDIMSLYNYCQNPNLQYICLNETIYDNVYLTNNLTCSNDGIQPNIPASIEVNSYCSMTPGPVYNDLFLNSKLDADTNGCDINDPLFNNFKYKIEDNNNLFHFYVTKNQLNSLKLLNGDYTITPILEQPNYFYADPTSLTVNFPSQTTPFTQAFCIIPYGAYRDLESVFIPTIPARPGFDAHYTIIYKNKGHLTESGTISLTYYENTVLDLVSSNPTINSQTANTLVWNYTNLQPSETRTIDVVFNVNSPTETPAVNIGDQLNFSTTINPVVNDNTPLDNSSGLKQTVVGSYDPNDKTCIEGTTVGSDMIGQYAHYVIRFENTGTYAAENVVVKDMIDLAKFDVNTLIPLHSSHDFVTRIAENKVEFIFEGINLPFDDANNDGYIAFKIKTKPNLVVGDTFSNNASIYFDYNFPIITNTYSTTIAALNTTDFDFGTHFTLYPNPVKEILNFQSKDNTIINSIEIYNTLGQIVLAVPNAISTIDVSSLQSGNYFVKVNTDLGISNTKFIKE